MVNPLALRTSYESEYQNAMLIYVILMWGTIRTNNGIEMNEIGRYNTHSMVRLLCVCLCVNHRDFVECGFFWENLGGKQKSRLTVCIIIVKRDVFAGKRCQHWHGELACFQEFIPKFSSGSKE